jgi:hypothetical protein
LAADTLLLDDRHWPPTPCYSTTDIGADTRLLDDRHRPPTPDYSTTDIGRRHPTTQGLRGRSSSSAKRGTSEARIETC